MSETGNEIGDVDADAMTDEEFEAWLQNHTVTPAATNSNSNTPNTEAVVEILSDGDLSGAAVSVPKSSPKTKAEVSPNSPHSSSSMTPRIQESLISSIEINSADHSSQNHSEDLAGPPSALNRLSLTSMKPPTRPVPIGSKTSSLVPPSTSSSVTATSSATSLHIARSQLKAPRAPVVQPKPIGSKPIASSSLIPQQPKFKSLKPPLKPLPPNTTSSEHSTSSFVNEDDLSTAVNSAVKDDESLLGVSPYRGINLNSLPNRSHSCDELGPQSPTLQRKRSSDGTPASAGRVVMPKCEDYCVDKRFIIACRYLSDRYADGIDGEEDNRIFSKAQINKSGWMWYHSVMRSILYVDVYQPLYSISYNTYFI
jgi:hypothetical protein